LVIGEGGYCLRGKEKSGSGGGRTGPMPKGKRGESVHFSLHSVAKPWYAYLQAHIKSWGTGIKTPQQEEGYDGREQITWGERGRNKKGRSPWGGKMKGWARSCGTARKGAGKRGELGAWASRKVKRSWNGNQALSQEDSRRVGHLLGASLFVKVSEGSKRKAARKAGEARC